MGAAESEEWASRRGRLLGLIVRVIDDYESRRSSLGSMITNIEVLLDDLSAAEPSPQTDEMLSLWSALDVTYAVALDEGRGSFTDEDRRLVDDTLSRRRRLASSMSTCGLERENG